MEYKKGDIITFQVGSNSDYLINTAMIVQSDWFNAGGPPSYIICLLSKNIYPELDFRPVIAPDYKNKFSNSMQVMVDKLHIIKPEHIKTKVGSFDRKHIKEVDGHLKAILGL